MSSFKYPSLLPWVRLPESFKPRSRHEFRNNTLPLLPPNTAVRSFHLACTHCTGWIDFTLFGFDNHVYCAMKCGVAEGWQYPSTRGNLLTARARWRYSLAQERSAHSDMTASVCAPGSLAVIYDASHAITLSLTLIQQFIYWWHAYGQRWASYVEGDKTTACHQLVPHP